MNARLLLASFLIPAAAMAAVEITPQVAYRAEGFDINTGIACVQSPCPTFAETDDGTPYGVLVGVPLSDKYQVQLLVNRHRSDLEFSDSVSGARNFLPTLDMDVTHLHVGLQRGWQLTSVEPFVAAGVGQTLLDSDPTAFGTIDLERWSASLAAGARVPLGASGRYGLRFEARGYWVDLPDERVGDNYLIGAEGRGLTQVETSAGFTFRF